MQRSGIILALISAVGFSTLAIFSKLNLAHGGNGTMLLAVRFLVAAAILWSVLFWRRQVPTWRQMRLPALMGLFGYVTMSYLFVGSQAYISPSLAAILLYTHPAIVTVLAAVIERHRIPGGRVLALLLASVGVVLVLSTQWGKASPVGIAMVLGASVVYSAYIVVGGKWLQGITPLQTTATVSLVAGVFLLLLGLARHQMVPVDGVAWLSMLGAATCATVLAVLCFFAALSRIGAGPTAIASSFEPVGTAVIEAMVWGAAFTLVQVLGAVLVLASVVLLQRQAVKPAAPVIQG